jgi:integrase
MASIRKRTWDKNGTEQTAWVVDYKDQAGKRHIKTFAQKKAAEAFRTKSGHEVAQGTHTADSAPVTVSYAAERWIKGRELDEVEPSTSTQYRQHIDLHINPLVGNVRLSRLTAPMVEEFKDKLLESRSRALARKVLQSLRSLLSDAQRRGLISQNVARGVTIRTSKRDKEPVIIPTKAEIKDMLTKVAGRWRPLIVTAIFTGMRASELRGLPWADIDFDAKVIHIRQRADRWNTIGPPKSATSRREIPMTPMAINTLRAWKLECPKGDLDLVFPNGKGKVEGLPNIARRGFGRCRLNAK